MDEPGKKQQDKPLTEQPSAAGEAYITEPPAERTDRPEEAFEAEFPAGGPEAAGENPAVKKRWFGRGIYGSKDVPIRLLDGLIAGLVAAVILLTVLFAVNGGFKVTFDTAGGNEIAEQKLRHGELVAEPEPPVKPGYLFDGWYLDRDDGSQRWDFGVDKVGGDLKLTAHWAPAQITVKFDLAGGSYEGKTEIGPVQVTFGAVYGLLPQPQKEGYRFGGWYYSGGEIKADTQVAMTGEHVLTAEWEEEEAF